MKHLKIYDNYILTSDKDIRYVIVVDYKDETYFNTIKGTVDGFTEISEITDFRTVIKVNQYELEEKLKLIKHRLAGIITYIHLEEAELLINANKYNL